MTANTSITYVILRILHRSSSRDAIDAAGLVLVFTERRSSIARQFGGGLGKENKRTDNLRRSMRAVVGNQHTVELFLSSTTSVARNMSFRGIPNSERLFRK